MILILFSTTFSYSEHKVNTSIEVPSPEPRKQLIYIVSDNRIPFWAIMGRGITNSASMLGYEINIYSSENNAKRELEFIVKAIQDKVSGIIVSPTNSSACVTILKLAKSAGIPVVISDVGTDGGEYVAYISSNNREGAYQIGKILTKKLFELGWGESKIGIIAIPQTRLNGQARTAGFIQAINESGFKGVDIKQQSTFTKQETYNLTKGMIIEHPDLHAIWLQGSNRYKGVLQAIADSGKKDKILLLTFDAQPEFPELIRQGILLASAMQQPYLMGQEAVSAMDRHLNGKAVEKNRQLPIIIISRENIAQQLKTIKRTFPGTQETDIEN
ncbi:MAG: substrate-binding domain-containing protein [gamma proteobacterium symbiont of Taylorina sp.]|nr:substrate-binding domain-containing protein [gamma proteobacterium symbiont of Taylorina sp.]